MEEFIKKLFAILIKLNLNSLKLKWLIKLTHSAHFCKIFTKKI